jgi:acyl carrier protein
MTKDDIADRVRKIIAETLSVDFEKAIDDASLVDNLDADSLEAVEVTMALEEEFNIEISDDEAEIALTVGQIIELVRGKVAP